MSNVRTHEETARERAANDAHDAHACAYHARRAFTLARERARLAALRDAVSRIDAGHAALYDLAMKREEKKIISAARFIESTRARLARQSFTHSGAMQTMTLARAIAVLKNCPLAQYNETKARLIREHGDIGRDAARAVDGTCTGG